ncbi:hypothetical protein B0A48_03302 [Cryoendolithus antarcticus]|uniref:F-box domain-containing protein n=1 Tax=Cryoendolithus antarcticus TaxID=1507870 RepID=A0A1V8TJM1_9PEZI|nr:hypothetical protein B0A48_03302 [Cryoendolithus antarcticus]
MSTEDYERSHCQGREGTRCSSSRFLDLPPELRTEIYRNLLVRETCKAPESNTPDNPSTTQIHLEVLRVLKQVHEEAAAVLYGNNVFRVRLTTKEGVNVHRACAEDCSFQAARRPLEPLPGGKLLYRIPDHANTNSSCHFRCQLQFLQRYVGLLHQIRALHLKLDSWTKPCDVKCQNSKIWHLVANLTTSLLLEDGQTRKEGRLQRLAIEVSEDDPPLQNVNTSPKEALKLLEILSPLAELPLQIAIECSNSAVQQHLREKQLRRPSSEWLEHKSRYVDAQRWFRARQTPTITLVTLIAHQGNPSPRYVRDLHRPERLQDELIDPSVASCLDWLVLVTQWEEERNKLAEAMREVVDKYNGVFGAMHAVQCVSADLGVSDQSENSDE